MRRILTKLLFKAHDIALNGPMSRLYSALVIEPPKVRRVNIGDVECRFAIRSNYENFYLSRFPGVSTNEAATFEILKECLRQGDVVFDVGANVGAYVVWLANDARARHVVAIEPDGENYATLKANVGINAKERVTCLPLAAADREGLRKFLHDGDAWGYLEGSTLLPERNQTSRGFDYVPCCTLDGLVRDGVALAPDILLIDVDGAEILVLQGAKESLRSSRMVIVEVASETEVEVDTLLAAAGYRMTAERKQRRGNRVYSKT